MFKQGFSIIIEKPWFRSELLESELHDRNNCNHNKMAKSEMTKIFEFKITYRLEITGPLRYPKRLDQIRSDTKLCRGPVSKMRGSETSGSETSGFKTSGSEMSGFKTSGFETCGLKFSGSETCGFKTSGSETSGFKTSDCACGLHFCHFSTRKKSM